MPTLGGKTGDQRHVFGPEILLGKKENLTKNSLPRFVRSFWPRARGQRLLGDGHF